MESEGLPPDMVLKLLSNTLVQLQDTIKKFSSLSMGQVADEVSDMVEMLDPLLPVDLPNMETP